MNLDVGIHSIVSHFVANPQRGPLPGRRRLLASRGSRLGLSRAGCVGSLCSVLLDDFLDSILGLIPVVSVQLDQVDAIVGSDLAQRIETLLVVDEANADTDTSKSASSTDTVQVGLSIRLAITSSLHGDVVVDDHGNTGNVDTTGQDIGGDENLVLSLAEFGQKLVSLRAIESGVKGRDLVTIRGHTSLNLVGALSSL